MTKLPGFMFYPGDWVKDPELSRCSKAAKGMWMDMLCKAFELKQRGKFITSQVPWTREEIAGAVGGDVTENLLLLNELISKHVAKIDKRGAIYSERMIHDERIRQIRSDAGSLGGRPIKYSKQEVVTQKSKSEANHKANGKQNTESENENNNAFEVLWSKYPRKDGKKESLKHYCASVKTADDRLQISQALENYLRHLYESNTEAKYIKTGKVWFNNWRDWINWQPKYQQAASRPVL